MALRNPVHLVLLCIFTGGSWLSLMNVADCSHLSQRPRYIGLKMGRNVTIDCVGADQFAQVYWSWSSNYGKKKENISSSHITINASKSKRYASVMIISVKPEDSGFYYCKVNDTYGPGMELKVFRHLRRVDAEKRSNMKDSMIIIQGLLLLLCIAAPVLLHFHKDKNEESIYEEPEDDHLYEGLTIEHCDLYEDIPACSYPAEAQWEGPESPSNE